MIFLLFSILCSTSILLIFKFIDHLKINIFPPIIINYIIATSVGSIISLGKISFSSIAASNWLFLSIIVGFMLIIMFIIMGLSTQKAGITVTIVAGRMSMIIPMVFSIIYYLEIVNKQKIAGIFLALIAVALTIYRNDIKKNYRKYLYLPIILFIGMGCTDTLVKVSQNDFIPADDFSLFTTVVFSISAIIGIIISIIKKNSLKSFWQPKTLGFGVLLGLVNYGSLLFFIKALQYSGLDSSVLFGINNLAIVGLSVILAFIIFREKIALINWIGVAISLLAIIVLNLA